MLKNLIIFLEECKYRTYFSYKYIFCALFNVSYSVTIITTLPVFHSFIYLFQTTEVHRHTHKTYNIYREKEHTKRDRQKETKHTETRRTILLSQTDSLLTKLTLELCIKVLKLGSPISNSIFVTLLYFGYPKKTLDTFRIARGKSAKCTNGKIRPQCRGIKADTVGTK